MATSFDPTRKGVIRSYFCQAIQNGMRDPAYIIAFVVATLKRTQPFCDPKGALVRQQLIDGIEKHRREAEALAFECLQEGRR